MRIINGTWFNCKSPKGCWSAGEYLLEKAPKAGIVIWVNNQAGVTGVKSFKLALEILKQEFFVVEKIKR